MRSEKIKLFFTGLKNLRSSLKNYTIILLIPLILGLALLYAVWQITKQQLEDAGTGTVNHFVTEISANMSDVEKTAYFISNDDLIRSLLSSDESKYSDNEELTLRMLHYTDPTELIGSAYIFSRGTNKVYSSVAPCVYSYSASAQSILSQYGLLGANETLSDDFYLSDGWYKAGDAVLSPCYVLNLDYGTGNMLVITLDTSVLLNYLLIIDADFCCIYTDGCSISNKISVSTGIDWNDDESVSRYLGMDVRCFRVEGDVYSYLIAIPTESYTRPVKMLISLFGIYFLLVVILIFSELYHLAKARYDRVSGLLDLLPASGSSSEEEIFRAVRSSLTEFKYTSEDLDNRRRSDNLRSLLLGSPMPVPVGNRSEYTGIPSYHHAMFVVCFSVLDYSVLSQVHPEDKAEVDGILRIVIKEALEYFSRGKLTISLSGSVVDLYPAVISMERLDGESAQLVHNIVERSINAIVQDYGIFLTASVSAPVSSTDELHTAYQDALMLCRLNASMENPAEVVSSGSDGIELGVTQAEGFIGQYRLLVNLIFTEKYDAIPDSVDTIITDYIEPRRDSAELFLNRRHLISDLLGELPQLRQSDEGRNLSRELRGDYSLSHLRELARKICALPVDGDKTYDAVEESCRYMEEHYADCNLCLNDICAGVNANVQTLSRQFKARKNTTIIQYLNTYRVTRASDLLASSSRTIQDISESVGYFSVETFVRNFKKVEGVTPSEYRKLLASQKNT